MVNFPTWIPDCDFQSPALLDLFISSNTSICSTMALPHWEILIMLLSQLPLTFHLKGGLLVILRDSIIFLSPLLDVTRMSMSTVSFLAQLDSLPIECFPLTYDLNGFKVCVRYIFASLFCMSKRGHL